MPHNNWIESIVNSASEQDQSQSSSEAVSITIIDEAAKHRLATFLTGHFTELTHEHHEDDEKSAALLSNMVAREDADFSRHTYLLSDSEKEYSYDQIKNLSTLLLSRGYLTEPEHLLTTKTLWSLADAVYSNLPIPNTMSSLKAALHSCVLGGMAFAYQLENSGVESVSFYTALNEIWPETFSKTLPLSMAFVVVAFISMAMMKNTHFFVRSIAGMTQEEFAQAEINMMTRATNAIDEIKEVGFDDEAASALYDAIVKPSALNRIGHDFCVFSSFFSSVSGDVALAYELLGSSSSPIMRVAAGLAIGAGDAGDTIVQANIARRHRAILNDSATQKLQPMLNNVGVFSQKLLNLSAVRQYFKFVSPIFVSLLRWEAAKKYPLMIGLDDNTMSGGLLGFQIAMAISAIMYGFIFSTFTVDKILQKEILQSDDPIATYSNELHFKSFSARVIGPLAVSLPVLLASQKVGVEAETAAIIAGSTHMALMLGLALSNTFAAYYSHAVELRFAMDMWTRISSIHNKVHKYDKVALHTMGLLLSAGLTTAGIYQNDQRMAAPGEVLLFVGMMSLLGNYSQQFMKAALFVLPEVFYYAADLKNLLEHTGPKEHFSDSLEIILNILILLFSMGIGAADLNALVKPEEKNTSDANIAELADDSEDAVVVSAVTSVRSGVTRVGEMLGQCVDAAQNTTGSIATGVANSAASVTNFFSTAQHAVTTLYAGRDNQDDLGQTLAAEDRSVTPV